MSKLCLMAKNALKSRVSPLNSTRILPSFRSFSTEGGEPQQDSSSSADPFLQPPQGFVFGRVNIQAKYMLKTDIIHYFEGCDLSPANVKVEYNRAYNPTGILLQFPSQSAFDLGVKQSIRKGRQYRLEKVDGTQWELMPSYDGKTVLLQGMPRTAIPEDIERVLSGFEFDHNFQIFSRPIGMNEFIRCALIRFPTALDAVSAFLRKNNSFCQNSPITMRVLQ
ncbi:uncharacterized protein LOC109849438 [Asparagus officinalis]|nr:uncharacterized protein LOC109849438 [Asparagus officinalis]